MLYRVLIDKVVVLDADVTLEDVEMAIKTGHDAIYSRSRYHDDYHLLHKK